MKKIGIIGCGNMGSAIAEHLKEKYQVSAFDKDKAKTESACGIEIPGSIAQIVKENEVIILAVKPQDFDAVLDEVKPLAKGKLIISIAAGISTVYIEKALKEARVVRAMPNIGMRIGESEICLCKGMSASGKDLDFARELFSSSGVVKELEEKMMHAATAIVGSGPAYIFDFIETNSLSPDNISLEMKKNIIQRMEEAAEAVGFSPKDALFFAVNIYNTSIDLIQKTKVAALELKKQVTSKGGTTEAALKVIHSGGSWEEAAKAALRRAGELERKE